MRGYPASRTGSPATGTWIPANGSSARGVARLKAGPTSGAFASRLPSAPMPKQVRSVAMIDWRFVTLLAQRRAEPLSVGQSFRSVLPRNGRFVDTQIAHAFKGLF